LRIIIRGVPGWVAGVNTGGLRVSRTKRYKRETRNTVGRYRNRKGEQACTQHDQVFIANFMDLVKKAYTPPPHLTFHSPLPQKQSNVRYEMLYSVE
jgi:hypothetical protein